MLIPLAIVLGTVVGHGMEESQEKSKTSSLSKTRCLIEPAVSFSLPRLNFVEGDTVNITPGQSLFLEPNIPNPFQGRTTIAYTLDRETRVTLRVFDAFYNEISILVDNDLQAVGRYEEIFDAGGDLASGMYFYSLTTSAGVETRRMLLVK